MAFPYRSPDTARLLLMLWEVLETPSASTTPSPWLLPCWLSGFASHGVGTGTHPAETCGTCCSSASAPGLSLPRPQALSLKGLEPAFSPLAWRSGSVCDALVG